MLLLYIFKEKNMNKEDFEDPNFFENSNLFEEYVEEYNIDFENEEEYIRMLVEKGEGLLMINDEDNIIYEDEDNMFNESK